jgi:hypothetical protein
MLGVLLAVVIALGSLSAMAAESDPATAIFYGHDLRKLCDADRQSGEFAMCFSYIAAVMEIDRNNTIYDLKVCIPPLANVAEAVDITMSWLHHHPQEDTKPASMVEAEALANAFPCKKPD